MCFDPVSATALLLASERGCNRGCGRCRGNQGDRERPSGERGCKCCCCCDCCGASARGRESEERAAREAERRRCDCVRPASASAPWTCDVLRPAATGWSTPISSCR